MECPIILKYFINLVKTNCSSQTLAFPELALEERITMVFYPFVMVVIATIQWGIIGNKTLTETVSYWRSKVVPWLMQQGHWPSMLKGAVRVGGVISKETVHVLCLFTSFGKHFHIFTWKAVKTKQIIPAKWD